ncbi:AsmA family protein [Rhodopila sp.]|uniref:AsmA family protein n=1 Tax=Rhodopila sp. TaxID=2480087 RepID=UPI003D0C5F36
MPRPLRITLIALAAVIVLAVGAGAVFISRFDPNSLKPRIAEAVKRATGRDLALNGKIGLKFSLTPTIRVDNVAFANPPGFSRPQMATLQSMELELGLLPLLSKRIEIERLVLIHPDILLEKPPTGQPNWQLTPEVSPTAPAGSQQPTPTAGSAKTAVSVNAIRIQDGTLAYRDDATAKTTTLLLPKLQATAASPDSPLHLDADASYAGTPLTLAADTGSLTRLQQPAATSPWPLKLTLTAAGAKLTADGSITQPLQGKGYNLTLNGTVPDASVLKPLLQGFSPPPLHDVTFAAKVADSGATLPDISSLTLHVGASDLNAQVPGLALDKLDLDAARLEQPMKLAATAHLGTQPAALNAALGPPAQLMPDAKPAPFPIDVNLQAAGATATAKGTLADARTMSGVNLALAAQIPDLSALSPLARRPLPAIKSIALQASLTDADGGLRQGAALHALTLTSADGDLAGDATLGLAARPTLTAVLHSNRIDLDAIQQAIDQTPAPTPPPPAPTPPNPAKPPAATQAPAAPAHRNTRLFSDQPIPFDLLRAADADLKLNIADLRSGGADYKAIDTHAVLANGKLAVNPFAADLPGGHLTGNLSADATGPAPPLHLVLHAPGLALKTLLTAFHQPSYANGNVELYADLSGAGASPHAIAGSLDGSLGLAMASGTIDNRLLGSLLGKVMDSLNALNLVGKGGTSELRCFALRIDAKHGLAAIKPLALSSSLLTMSGLGTINLGAETLAMALRPQARVGGTGLVIPIAVSGPIRDPSVKVNDLGAAEANAGTVAGVVLGNATPLGVVGGLLGADKLLGGGTSDICPAALAAARGQPAPQAAAAKSPQPNALPNPAAVLKNLFR